MSISPAFALATVGGGKAARIDYRPAVLGGSPSMREGREMRDVAAGGARVRADVLSSGPDGAPLLLVHGFLETRASFAALALALSRRYRVLVPDLPGSGESEKPPARRYDYGPRAFAGSLVDLLSGLGEGRATVLGVGTGCAVALTMAAEHAASVGRLILLAPEVNDPPRDRATRLLGAPVLGPLVTKQLLGRRVFRRLLGRGARSDRFFEDFDTPAAREAAHATARAMSDGRAHRAAVPRVTVPTLVGCVGDDPAFTVGEARHLARELLAGKVEIFACGHRFTCAAGGDPERDACAEELAARVAAFVEPPVMTPRPAAARSRDATSGLRATTAPAVPGSTAG